MGTGAPPGIRRPPLAGRAADPRSPARPASGHLDGSCPADTRADRRPRSWTPSTCWPATCSRRAARPWSWLPGAGRAASTASTTNAPTAGRWAGWSTGSGIRTWTAGHLGPVRAHHLGAVRPRRRPRLPLRPGTPYRRHRGLVPAPARRGVAETLLPARPPQDTVSGATPDSVAQIPCRVYAMNPQLSDGMRI